MKGRFTIITILKSMRNPIESEKVLDFVLENTEGDSMEDKKVEKKEKKIGAEIRPGIVVAIAAGCAEIGYEKFPCPVQIPDVQRCMFNPHGSSPPRTESGKGPRWYGRQSHTAPSCIR